MVEEEINGEMILMNAMVMRRFGTDWLAGWQPVVYSKTAARLLKAVWCLLRIATPYAVLRRLTEVAVRPAANDSAQEKITPAAAKENSGYLNIRAIYLHSSKGDTESTEFEMQEEQNASTRIRQSLPPRL